MSLPRRAWVLLPFVALSLLAACGRDERPSVLETETRLYSQYDEELVIRDFFGDRRNGFFVDVGAWHARTSSTTYYLEKHLDWNGIAIDAQSSLASEWAIFRPRSRFFVYIVTDHSGGRETLYLAGAVSSVEPSHREELVEMGLRKEPPGGEPIASVEVETITLNELLDREGVGEIDFLSMDIEQSEPQALAGFDIERFRPELVCIEVHRNTQERIAAYFERHGYERIDADPARDPVNWYFAPVDR